MGTAEWNEAARKVDERPQEFGFTQLDVRLPDQRLKSV
jgi:hypothetical protein